jgi:N-acyl-D-amino-acid deacylase
MRRREFIRTAAGAAATFGVAGDALFGADPSFDLIIRNGTVVDGLGSPGFAADVGISAGRIAALGDLKAAKGASVIDASGRVVCPGFIDIHNHSEAAALLLNKNCESMIRQGVTTQLAGNCGGSSFPLERPEPEDGGRLLREAGIAVDWTDLDGLLAKLRKQGLIANWATLVGQGTIRTLVMNEERREPTADELERMKALVASAMEQGAFGLSTGLEYTPSGFASVEEVVELAKVAARYGGFYATHMRSEDTLVVEATAEAIHIAEAAGLPLEISHFKVCGTTNWWKHPMLFDLVERAAGRGVRVTADRYPYTAYNTGLSVNFPQRALDGGSEALVKRLQDPEERRKLKPETLEKLKGTSWDDILLIEFRREENKGLVGKTLGQAASERRADPYDVMCDLIISEGGNVSYVGFGMSEEQTVEVLTHPLVMLCTDGFALAPTGPLGGGMPHPRSYGTFPRFLGVYVREKKALSLPEAVRKMTSMPAAKLGLADRGVLRRGCWADVVVFDPKTVADTATYTRPEQYPVGIDQVLVNGRVVLDRGRITGVYPGQALVGPGRS